MTNITPEQALEVSRRILAENRLNFALLGYTFDPRVNPLGCADNRRAMREMLRDIAEGLEAFEAEHLVQ